MVLRCFSLFLLATVTSQIRFEGNLQARLGFAIHDAENAGQGHLLVVADLVGEPFVAVAERQEDQVGCGYPVDGGDKGHRDGAAQLVGASSRPMAWIRPNTAPTIPMVGQ